MDHLTIGCACILALVFAVSAASKLRGRAAFDEFAYATRTLLTASAQALRGAERRRPGERVVRFVALGVAMAEAVAVPLVAVPATARVGFGLAAVLLTCFSVAIALTLRRGVSTACRCFGAASAPLSRRHLVRNALLLAVAVAGLVTADGSLDGVHPAGAAVAAVTGAVAAVLLIRIDDLADLFAPAASTPTRRRRS